MKEYRGLFNILLAVLLLSGCAQVGPGETVPSETPPAITEPTAPATTEPTGTPTTEPMEPQPAYSWLTEPVYPSYEAFLKEAPAFAELNSSSWLIIEGDKGREYSISRESFSIVSNQKVVYRIPDHALLGGYAMFAADGRHGYARNDTEIVKLDLQTGNIVDKVQTGRRLALTVTDSFVLYYTEHDGASFNICRVYLPEMKRDVLDSLEAPAKIYEDDNTGAPSGNGKLRWAIRNPEMMELLEAELKNPESSYQKAVFNGEEVDFSYVWKREDPLEERALNDLDMFLYTVQEKSGIRAFVEYEYDLKEGLLSLRTAIIDNCYFGTGKPHDHDLPEITEIDGPTVVNGPWNPTPGWDIQGTVTGKPSSSFSVEQRRFGTGPVKLYLKENGYLTEIAEMSLQNMQLRDDGIWGITQDNRVVQLSYDGTVCNTLYAGAGALKDIIYLEKGFYLVDNGQLVEVDTETGKYRVLVRQEHMWDIDYWIKQEGTLYFLASYGLAYQQHKYDPATGTIERVSVMW